MGVAARRLQAERNLTGTLATVRCPHLLRAETRRPVGQHVEPRGLTVRQWPDDKKPITLTGKGVLIDERVGLQRRAKERLRVAGFLPLEAGDTHHHPVRPAS